MSDAYPTLSHAAGSAEQEELLRAHFFQWREIHPTASIYVLLDQSRPVKASDELHPSRLATREISVATYPVARPDLAHEPDTLPLLVQLYGAGQNGYRDEQLLGQTLCCARARCRSVNGAYVAAWICTDTVIEVLAAHLAQAGVTYSLNQRRQRFLPLFEPHRTALLMDDPGSAGFLARWMGPIRHWMFMDSSGLLRVHNAASPSQDSGRCTLLSRGQYAMQGRAHLARMVILALERTGVIIPVKAERRIDLVLARAEQHGLAVDEDLIFFALNTFTLGEDWCTHPEVTRLVGEVKSGIGQRLSEAMSALPDDVLNEIASGSARRA